MKITQFIKQLNGTEVGEHGTNDSYAAIPNNIAVDLAEILPTDEPLELTDVTNGKIYKPEHNIRLQQTNQNSQFRIAGLGQFFTDYNTTPGDRFLLEIHDDGKKQKLLIGLYHRPDVIVLQKLVSKGVNGMIILNKDRFEERATGRILKEKLYADGNLSNIEVHYLYRGKKKENSKDETDIYDLQLDGASILDRYKNDEYVEIDLHEMTFRSVIRWQKNTLKIK